MPLIPQAQKSYHYTAQAIHKFSPFSTNMQYRLLLTITAYDFQF